MRRVWLYSLVMTLFIFSGCGSDNKTNIDAVTASEDKLIMSISDPYDPKTEDGTVTATFSVVTVNAAGNPVSGLNLIKRIVVGGKINVSGTGQIYNDSNKKIFTDYMHDFIANKVVSGDTLLVFPMPNRMDPSYVGDWKITAVKDAHTLELGADVAYNLEAMDELSYIIGSNSAIIRDSRGTPVPVSAYIQNPVKQPGESSGSRPSNAEKGTTKFEVVYPEALGGHPVCIGVHVSGNRSGTARCVNLP